MKLGLQFRVVCLVLTLAVAALPYGLGMDAVPSVEPPGIQRPIRLAAIGFVPPKDADNFRAQNEALIDLLTVKLSAADGFQLIERSSIDSLTAELSLSLSQGRTTADSIRVGKLLQADWLLLGSVIQDAGADTLIARIVDARTGIIRDLVAIPFHRADLVNVVTALTGFITNSASRISETVPRIFLGIGGFENLGINELHSDFRKNLRAALELEFAGSRFAVVERTMVNPLLQELRLNHGGLTESTNPAALAQPAFLLVDGIYQSYRAERSKINLILRVQEIGGAQRLYSLNEPPGKELHQKVATILSNALAELQQNVSGPPRRAEAATQLSRGIERAQIRGYNGGVFDLGGYPPMMEREKRLKNITEAMEAFEAALLLDPDCVEAKFYLAVCQLDPQIKRKSGGRDYLNEVIATATNRLLVVAARCHLALSYEEEDDRRALELLLALSRDLDGSDQNAIILRSAMSVAFRLHQKGGLTKNEGIKLIEQSFAADCRLLVGANRFPNPEMIRTPFQMDNYFGSLDWMLGLDREASALHMDQFVPKLAEQFPTLAPYLWMEYAPWRNSVSNPVPANVMMQFRASLEYCRDQPTNLAHYVYFYSGFVFPLLEWCVSHEEYRGAEILGEIIRQVQAMDTIETEDVRAFLRQETEYSARSFYYAGYCQRGLGKWAQALEAFQVAQKKAESVIFDVGGPWGQPGKRIYAKDLIAECHRNLPLADAMSMGATNTISSVKPPVVFTLGYPVLKLRGNVVFACDDDRIWLTDGFEPSVYDQRNQRLTGLGWPANIARQVTCIRKDKNTVWWATPGSGLVELDKATKQFRMLRETEGLLMPNVTALALDQNRLWIGFGRGEFGGLGYLDVTTRHFTGLTAELDWQSVTNRFFASMFSRTEAPRSQTHAICLTADRDLWLLSEDFGLRHYSVVSNRWSLIRERILSNWYCMAANSNYVAIGGVSDKGGVVLYDISKQKLEQIDLRDAIGGGSGCVPPNCYYSVTSMVIDHRHLWIGGAGFLAAIDLETKRVERLCDFDTYRNRKVQCMEVAGNDLWFAIENKLYRMPKTGSALISRR